MRNAAAQFDDDLAFDRPARKPKGGRKAKAAGGKKAGRRPAKGGHRYVRFAAIGLSASLVVGIMVNALVLQHSRHPAPLFGKAIQLGEQPATVAVTPPPQPAAALVQPSAPAAIPASPAMPAPVQRPHAAKADVPPPAAHAKGDDPIAKLLKTSAPSGTSEKAVEKPHEKDNPKTVLAAQHALMKLGFVVKPNGTFGPATKAALEAFERDQHLPVKGELSRKIVKQLSAESGVAID